MWGDCAKRRGHRILCLAVLLAACSGAAAAQDQDDHDLLEVAVGGDHDFEDLASPVDRLVRLPTPSIAFIPRIEPLILSRQIEPSSFITKRSAVASEAVIVERKQGDEDDRQMLLDEERGYFLKHDADGDGALDENEFLHHWVASVPPDSRLPWTCN